MKIHVSPKIINNNNNMAITTRCKISGVVVEELILSLLS
jgi:hypothetical protein